MSLASQSYLSHSSDIPNPPSINTQSPISLPPPYPESNANATSSLDNSIPRHGYIIAYSNAYLNRIGFKKAFHVILKELWSTPEAVPWNPYPFLYDRFQTQNQMLHFNCYILIIYYLM